MTTFEGFSSAVRAQIVRVIGKSPLDINDIDADKFALLTLLEGEHEGDMFVEFTVRRQISLAEYVAILTPIDLQALNSSQVARWTPGMLAEYRRQYDARMLLPNPPLIRHPDEVDRWWNAARS